MNQDGTLDTPSRVDSGAALASWVMGNVNRWRTHRDTSFKARWGQYYRLWRGRWMAEDKNKSSERSKLVAPALSQAIEMTVAELEEATFGREPWVDIEDDPNDKAAGADQDVAAIRKQLMYDLKRAKVRSEVSASYLNGALYGALIAKVVVDQDEYIHVGDYQPDADGSGGSREISTLPTVTVRAVSIPADEFVPDPSAECIEDMLGCAHEVIKPKSWLTQMVAKKVYKRAGKIVGSQEAITSESSKYERGDLEATLTGEDGVLITEYHGLVPARLIPRDKTTEIDKALDSADEKSGDDVMVEAIVTIEDKRGLLAAIVNPFDRNDRSIVACPYERVPGRFFGRSVAEKGFNPQKALDAELRARMDALALISNPMMGADITKLPRGFDFSVRPGKVWLTNGSPKDVLEPVQFQGLDGNTFNQSSEMERMVQMGTGAMDTATPIAGNGRNETATGTSLIVGSFVKRAKRSKAYTDENFLEPLIQKIVWRYMQYDPKRYPKDVEFRCVGTLGLVARELEQAQLTQMLGVVPQGSAPQWVLIQSIFDSSSSQYKDEMKAAIAQAMQPDPKAQQMAEQMHAAEIAKAQADIADKQASAALKQGQTVLAIAQAQVEAQKPGVEQGKLNIEVQKLYAQLAEIQQYSRQIDVSAIKAHAELLKARKQGE